MSLIPQFKTELQYIPTVKACLKLSQVDCFCLRLKGSLEGGDRWVRLHEESLEFHPRFFPVFEEKREN